MEKTSTPAALPATPRPPKQQQKESPSRKPPTPQELIAHYEAQGVDAKEAPLKAIEDLQNVLIRVLGSTSGRKDRFMGDTGRKLDSVNTRLAIVEMKLDSKPGYAENVAIGVASGLAARGIASVAPSILGAVGQIWNAVKRSST